MNILVIGGTRFIGRHVVKKLQSLSHKVTLLNRGITNPELFREVERIAVDRKTDDLNSLKDKNWDAVIDLSAHYPADVKKMVQALEGVTGHYLFCSTTAVYPGMGDQKLTSLPMFSESIPTLACSSAEATDESKSSYGRRKAEAERVALHAPFPVTVFRPGYVYGPYDPSDRLAYWIQRAQQNDPFLLPDEGLMIVRRTYAPDLSTAFCANIGNSKSYGKAYNIAESSLLSLRQTLELLGEILGTQPLKRAVSVSSSTLQKAGVLANQDIPFWMPFTHFIPDTLQSNLDLKLEETPIRTALEKCVNEFKNRKTPVTLGLTSEQELEIINSIKR